MLVRMPAALVVVAVLSAVASRAEAQDNSAAVEALFNEGKRLVVDGRLAEACPKFLASYNLEQRLGTLLNLADCYEKNQQLASAWARFVEARTLAQRGAQQERAEYAATHAAALAPKLSTLTIALRTGAPGIEIKRDGVVVDPAAIGVPVPVDSGTHTIAASAPGRQRWSGEVLIGTDADRKSVEVPVLEDAPRAEVGPASAEPARRLHPRAFAGLVVAGVGVVGIGVGTAFGIVALGKKGDSDPFCGQKGGGANDCNSEGVGLRQDAVSAGNLSTVFLSAGAALLVGGIVLWLTAPSSSNAASRPAKPLVVTF